MLALAPAAKAQGYSNYDPSSHMGSTWPASGPEFTNLVGFQTVVLPDGVVVSGKSAATSFQPQSDYLLTSVTIPLTLTGGDRLLDTRLQYLTGYLFADNGGKPSSILATFNSADPATSRTTWNFSDNGTPGMSTAPHTTFNLDTAYSLTAGATFWFGVGPSPASSSIYSGVDLNTYVAYGDTWAWELSNSTNGANRMTITSNSIPTPSGWGYYADGSMSLYEGSIVLGGSAVPEPSTYAAIAGVIGLVVTIAARRKVQPRR